MFVLAVAVAALALTGGGVLAALEVNDGLFGSAESEAVRRAADRGVVGPSEGDEADGIASLETTVQGADDPEIPAGSPPDPAFDHLVASLTATTDAPVMLPAELPDDMDLPAIDGYYDGDGYGIVFPYGPSETTTMASNAETLGTLTAYLEDEDVANEYFDAERIDEVTLADGTEATLRYMVPAGRSGSQGPFWEGKFDKDGYTYNLKITKPEEITEEEVRQALSTMVLVPGGGSATGGQVEPTGTETTEPLLPEVGDPAEVEEAAGDYYRAAGVEDWAYTYDNLDSDTQSKFTDEEWFDKNQWLADNGEVIYDIDSVYQTGTSTEYWSVALTLTYEDGTSSTRTTYFVYEDGGWKHRFGQEENDLFMPDATFEEFVRAKS